MQLIPIGYLKKPHGTKGEIKVQIEDAYWNDFQRADTFFVKLQGQALPYFKQRIRTAPPITIHFEGIDTRESAKQLAAQALLLRAEDISSNLNETLGHTTYEGFLLIDKESGEIGVIEEILELPQQKMAVVAYRGKEVMIPLNDAFITHIDESDKHIKMDLPDGLLDL